MSSQRFQCDQNTSVLCLTGAGVSAESGIATFRGSSGLWQNHPIEKVASMQGFIEDPNRVWRFYSERRSDAAKVTPNAGHKALAELEKKLGERFLLATQNVDGLHQKAGSQRVLEMHGNLFQTRCSRCTRPAFEDTNVYIDSDLPGCGRCHEKGEFALLRPNIVWFGEALPDDVLERISAFVVAVKRLVFLAVGTSGRVYPAAALVDLAKRVGASTWLVNAEAPENVQRFDHFIEGESGKILPDLFANAIE